MYIYLSIYLSIYLYNIVCVGLDEFRVLLGRSECTQAPAQPCFHACTHAHAHTRTHDSEYA